MKFLKLLKKHRYTLKTCCRWRHSTTTVTLLFTLLTLPTYSNAQSITGINTVCVGSSSLLSILSIGGTWSSSNAAVVTVSSGLITGVSAGTATITYSTLLGLHITDGVTVNALPNPGTISGGTQVCIGGNLSLSSTGTGGGIWSTVNSFASVLSGVVTGTNFGSETIRYTVSNSCGSASASATVNVVAAVNNIYTLAGNGTSGFGGDGGPAYSSVLSSPRDLFTDSLGDVYFCDLSNNRVRKITRAGTITTIAGNGTAGNTGDGGPATAATLSGPNGVFINNSGNVLISNTNVHTIRKINTAGVITTIAGTSAISGFAGDGGPATACRLFAPQGVLEDASGNTYIADQGNNRIRKIDASTGIITTVVGNGTTTYRSTDDGGPATAAQLSVRGITIDREGNIYIADPTNNRIRKYLPSTGIITTIAGTGLNTRSGDGGPATAASLAAPARFAYDGANILYVTDQNNQCIRAINMVSGLINTAAGNTTAGFSGDGGLATAAQLRGPVGIAADIFGNFFIADGNNFRIRIVNSKGSIVISSTAPSRICANTTVTLNAFSSVSGIMAAQWQKNGSNVGSNSATYIETSPANGDVFRCLVTVTPPCGSAFVDSSNIITLVVDPAVSSISGVGATLCVGATATLSNSAAGGTWSSGSAGIASIGSSGLLTGVSSGTAVVSYSDPNICGTNTATLTVNITVPSTITASSSSNGSISPSGVTSVCGGNQAYAITPTTGYHVSSVTVDGSSVGAVATYTFTSVSTNHTISATFAINTYSITATAGSNGTVTPSGTSVVNYGDAPGYTFTAATGYHISDVQVDGSSVGAVSSYTFSPVSAGHTISVTFAVNTFSVTASAGSNGIISPSGTSIVNYGDAPTYTITASSGYRISDVQVDGSSVGAVSSYTFSPVSAGHTISATFAVNTFSVTASAGSNGTITPPGTSVISYGDMPSYTIAPSTGYYISDVQVDGSSVGAVSSYTFSSVSASHTISATFAINIYSVTASAGSNGTITPSGTSVVNYGDAPSYVIAPSTGYHIDDIQVDGSSVGAVATYTFSPVSAGHTISATFAINTYSVTASAGSNGTITPSGTSVVNYGDWPSFAFTPATGYHISDVQVDGSSVGAASTYTFSSISSGHTISATFAVNTYSVTASAGSNGTITPSGTSVVNYGDWPSFAFTPTTGYHVDDVQVDGSSIGAVAAYTFSPVSSGHTISATFAINTYSVTASAGSNGTITPSGTSVVNYGDWPSFTFTAATGYHISDVQVDGSSIGAVSSYTFSSVSAGHTISATFAINTYSVVATSGSNGSITPGGTSVVNYGDNLAYSIVPDLGHHIIDVLVDGASVGAVNTYTFTAVAAGHTISATFAINTCTLTATSGSNGSISPAGAITVDWGDNQTYAVTPGTGYHVSNVTVDGVSVGAVTSYTFSGVAGNHILTASFAINTYTITATAGTNGSIAPVGSSVVSYGDTPVFTVTPNTGYHITDVTVDGSSVGAVASYTFTPVSSNHTIAASFAINTYSVTASAGTNGTITPSGTSVVNYGDMPSYTIAPSTGYHISDVQVDGSSVGTVSSYTFSLISAGHTIAATFAINTYSVTASAGTNGTITPSGTSVVNYGDMPSYTIAPSTGYHISDVQVDGSSVGAVSSYTFSSISAGHTVSVTFAINTYSVTASAGTNGTITPSGTSVVNYGDMPSYTIAPSTGYHISDVQVDGSSVGTVSSYTFSSISAGHTIAATFAINTYSFTASAGTNGTITPSGTSVVNYGDMPSYTIAPSTGYHISDVQVDGSSVGAVLSYTFSSVIAGHTISATFAINTYSVTASAGANGTITPSGTSVVNYGDMPSYTIAPSTGYHISDVQVDGSSVGAVSSYTFSSVSAGHTISATFAINTYSVTASAGTNGTITPSGTSVVNYGDMPSYTVAPSTGYHISDVQVDGSSVGAVATYTFSPVAAGHTISATFAINTYTITASAGSHGTVTPSGTAIATYGDAPSYVFTPSTNYHVSDVQVDGSSVGAVSSYTFSPINAGHTISATFAINTYSITASAGSHGTITPSGTSVVSYGGTQSFAFAPATGYHISDIQVDGSSIGVVSSYTFSAVTAGHTISAMFTANTFSVTASVISKGSISPSGTSTVSYGDTPVYTFTPNSGYHVSNISVDGSSVGAASSYTFSPITGGHTLVVTFAINTYTITASAGSHGSISPSGALVINHGSTTSYTITTTTGYHVDDVLVDGSSVGAVTSYTFSSVTSGHTISVSFAINTYTVTASAGSNGSVSPSGTTTINYGGSQVYTITPSAGYHITGVTVDGSSVGVVTTRTFSSVTANHTISATFAINTYTVTASVGSHGSISPSGSTSLNYGDSQAYSITPSSGYRVDDVTVDGSSIGAVSTYTFTSVAASHTIHATFTLDVYTISASHGPHGSISPSGTTTLSPGDSQLYTITPSSGYIVSDVLVDGSSIGDTTSFTFLSIAADHTISVSFESDGGHGHHKNGQVQAVSTDHVAIFPNPTSGIFNVVVPADQKEATIVIIDMAGKTVLTKMVTDNDGQPVQIDLTAMPRAAYIVNVRAGKYSTSSRISVE